MKILIIGGGTAGSEVAWRLRQQNKKVEITILEKSRHRQYSPCALPYVISGEIKNLEDIFLFNKSSYEDNAIKLLTDCEVEKIDRKNQQVFYLKDNKTKTVSYDRLVITTGCKFAPPKIPGLNKCFCHSLAKAEDAETILKEIKPGNKAIIIGAGYIGLELAGALSKQGLETTLLDSEEFILPSQFDKELSSLIQAEIENKGAKVFTQARIKNISQKQIAMKSGETLEYDQLFLCCGLIPDVSLAKKAGLACSLGIATNENGQSSDKKIYVCGDAAESINLIDDTKTLSHTASIAIKQAEVVASNLLGKKKKKEKILNTSISRFGNLVFGSTGATENYCRENSLGVVSAFFKGESSASYYPKNKPLWIKITADTQGIIIGCQVAGYQDVAGRLNMAALAIKQRLFLQDLVLNENCYNPSISHIFDPMAIAAEICLKKLNLKNERVGIKNQAL